MEYELNINSAVGFDHPSAESTLGSVMRALLANNQANKMQAFVNDSTIERM